jgi:hypothetical protein
MEGHNRDAAEPHAADACQDCGSPNVEHRSLMRREGDRHGAILLLCGRCHHARLAFARAFEWG